MRPGFSCTIRALKIGVGPGQQASEAGFTKCGLLVSSCGRPRVARGVHQNAILLNRINVIWVVQSPSAKIFPFPPDPNQIYIDCRPAPTEGRFAIVTDVRRDAVDALATQDERRNADGEVVWS
jgi:hypothetical protein